MSVSAYRNSKRSSQPKVSQFYETFFINQKILWLQISVKNSSCMAEIHSVGNLVEITLRRKKNF